MADAPRPTPWTPRLWRWHRWLAWLVGVQVAAWVIGGALFAWLPFQGWVKSADVLTKPSTRLPSDWAAALQHAARPDAPVLSVASVLTAHGMAWHIRHDGQADTWLDAHGQPLPEPDEAAVRRFAQSFYAGTGHVLSAQRWLQPPPRWGIVREVSSRGPVWAVQFDDALRTRIYIDARSGQFVAARNEAWVLYDFFWRLHVMDYSGGEDFNHPLLRAATLMALALLASGIALLALSWRRYRRRSTASRPGHLS